MTNQISGFVQAHPDLKLERMTFLGPKGSGAFSSLSEAVVWARLLGGQCGGIVHHFKYGYMLTHGHLFVEKSDKVSDQEIDICWSKGSDHLSEPAYPYSKSGFSRFRREVREQEANGREFLLDFYQRYIHDDWRKMGRKDFKTDIDNIYSDAAKPGWREWAWSAGVKAIGSGIRVLGEISGRVNPLDVEDNQFILVHRDGSESPDLVEPEGSDVGRHGSIAQSTGVQNLVDDIRQKVAAAATVAAARIEEDALAFAHEL